MKRSILFWPVVSAVAAFLLWVGSCFFVIGLVIGAPTSGAPVAPRSTVPTYWSPAAALSKGRQSRTPAHLLSSLVNGLWRVAPYSRAPRPEPEAGSAEEQVELLILNHYYHSRGRTSSFGGHMVVLVPTSGWTTYRASILSVWPPTWVGLSRSDVLVYVSVIPGVHFALAAFLLALVVNVATKLLFKAIGLPEGAPRESAKEERAQP